MNEYTGSQDIKTYLEWASKEYGSQRVKLFPPGKQFEHEGETLYACGYADRGDHRGVFASRTDPSKDYDEAIATKKFICVEAMLKPITKV